MATENSSGLNTGALVGAIIVGALLIIGVFLSLGGDTTPEVPAVEPVAVEASESVDSDSDVAVETSSESALEAVSPTAQ